jgi:CheY-specific phosphatase CheX
MRLLARLSITALAAMLVMTAHAAGEFKTGNEVKAGLEGWVRDDSTETVRDAVAFGYVIGVHDALSGSVICSGDNVTQGQVVQVVLKYMRNNPEVLDQSADRVITAALKAVWPCAQSS